MNLEASRFRIIAEDVDGQTDWAFSKPDEPSSIFLIRLNIFVLLLN